MAIISAERLSLIVELGVFHHRARRRVFRRPSEQRRIERFSARGVAGRQLTPAERPGLGENLCSDVFFGFPELKHSAGRILQDRHSSYVHDVERRCQHLGAKRLGLLRTLVDTRDGHIQVPMRWRAVLPLFGRIVYAAATSRPRKVNIV
jgi:hypothetical protein